MMPSLCIYDFGFERAWFLYYLLPFFSSLPSHANDDESFTTT
jgi:hypothetical protein